VDWSGLSRGSGAVIYEHEAFLELLLAKIGEVRENSAQFFFVHRKSVLVLKPDTYFKRTKYVTAPHGK
jgi:hypothetical protein